MGLPNVFSSPRKPNHDVEKVQAYLDGKKIPLSPTCRLWLRRQQRLWLLFHFSWRWLITAALVASTAGVLVAYERKPILSTSDKHVFNFLITGLVIVIGVNFTGALNHFAENARWLFVSCTGLPPRLFELVMEIHSQTKVFRLLCAAKGRWMIQVMCVLWLLLYVGVQVLAALLGLTYEISNPVEVGRFDVEAVRGNASVVDLSFIHDAASGFSGLPAPGTSDYLNSQRAAANTYGQQSNEWVEVQATIKTFIEQPGFFVNYYQKLTETKWRWLLRFNDYPASDLYTISVGENLASHRAIGARAVCDNDATIRDVKYGVPSVIDFTARGVNHSITVANNIWNSTTYISDTRPIYGSRTSRVLVFWSGESGSTHKPLQVLYDCNSTMTEVQHLSTRKAPVRDELQLHDTQARIIAGAVGWAGFGSNATFQTHTYAVDSRWSFNTELTAWGVADEFVSRFAIGVINAMNFNAPRIIVDDVLVPNGGVVLSVTWAYAGTVLGLIGGLHLLLLLAADLLLCKVLIRDNGMLATALFLRPLLTNIRPSGGGMLTSEEIADTIKHNVVYTWDEQCQEGDGDKTSNKEGATGVKFLKAKTVLSEKISRRPFDDGVYD